MAWNTPCGCSLMRDRIDILHTLLHEEGTLFVHIDDNELAYLIMLLDEKFGRKNRASTITFKQASATGHKSINPGCVSVSNYILMYAKDKSKRNSYSYLHKPGARQKVWSIYHQPF